MVTCSLCCPKSDRLPSSANDNTYKLLLRMSWKFSVGSWEFRFRFVSEFLDGAVVDDTAEGFVGLEGVVFGHIDIGEEDERLGDPVLERGVVVGDVEHLVFGFVEFILFEGGHGGVIGAFGAIN